MVRTRAIAGKFKVIFDKSDRYASGIIRFGLIVNFLINGLAKFTEKEARGVEPWLSASPLFSWALPIAGLRNVSDAIGVVELITVLFLLVGVRVWAFNTVAVVLSCGTFLSTLSFLVTSPAPSGFSITALDAFLLKDIVLLGASLSLLRDNHQHEPGAGPR